MSKFKFMHEEDYQYNSKIEVSTEAVVLSDILEEFENFLRGCGFHFEGTLEIVNEEEVYNEHN